MSVRISRAAFTLTVVAATMVATVIPAGATVPAKKAKDVKVVKVVKVVLTDDGCPAKLTVKAGPNTFEVSNTGSGSVSEFEILSGDRIIGEVENIAPGLTGEFSLSLKPGTYPTKCPGGDKHSTGKLVVTGTADTTLSAAGKTAVVQYRSYLEAQTALLVSATKTFVDAVQSGNVDAAKTAYGPARVPYESIEPVAETFGDLDPRIDAREGDVPAAEWGGFHRIEKALWVDNTTDGMSDVAGQLQKDVEQLANLVRDVQLEPAAVANGAVELLNEVSASKITGEEERYSRIDLLDFEGNLQGAKAAFDAVKPLLAKKDPSLASGIDTKFAAVDTALGAYKPGGIFVLYTALTESDTKALAVSIDVLAEPLSKVGRKIVSS